MAVSHDSAAGVFPNENIDPSEPIITSSKLHQPSAQASSKPEASERPYTAASEYSTRDSDSSLSDVGDADSEAETERLEISPHKKRSRIMVEHSNARSITKTIPMDSVVQDDSCDELSERPTAKLPIRSAPGTPSFSLSLKRKREGDYSPDRRHMSESSLDRLGNLTENRDNYASVLRDLGEPRGLGLERELSVSEETRTNADSGDIAEVSLLSEFGPMNDDVHDLVDGGELLRDDDDDSERASRKKLAMDELAEIERIFAQLKDSIYSDKLRRLELEMKLLQEGSHPDFVAQKGCVDQRLEEKLRLAESQFKYAMQSLDMTARVHKAQAHAQYFQQVRYAREEALYECSEIWYHIQRERRIGDALVPEFTFKMSNRDSVRVKQRAQYNWEVAILSGISRNVGFPAAPDIDGLSVVEKDEDLEAIGIVSARDRSRGALHSGALRLDKSVEREPPLYWMQQSHPSSTQQGLLHPHPHHHHHHHHLHPHPPRPVINRQTSDAPLLPVHAVHPTGNEQFSFQQHRSPVPLSTLLSSAADKVEFPIHSASVPFRPI